MLRGGCRFLGLGGGMLAYLFSQLGMVVLILMGGWRFIEAGFIQVAQYICGVPIPFHNDKLSDPGRGSQENYRMGMSVIFAAAWLQVA